MYPMSDLSYEVVYIQFLFLLKGILYWKNKIAISDLLLKMLDNRLPLGLNTF